MKPYIGITDFNCQKEVESMLAVFAEAFPKGDRDLMVGTMMSYKTLCSLPTKWAAVFPKEEAFGDIYPSRRELLLNTLHYADYDALTTSENLMAAIVIAGHRGTFKPPSIDALQLDMIWPSKELITSAFFSAQGLIDESTKLEESLSHLKIILQVGSVAMDRLGNEPQRIAQRIRVYGDSIHCVLFDRSGGLGKKMDADLLRSYIIETKSVCPGVSIAVAGGLGPETMHLVASLVQEFPDISIDAQGKLRKSGSALDPIDWDLAEKYLREAGKVFS